MAAGKPGRPCAGNQRSWQGTLQTHCGYERAFQRCGVEVGQSRGELQNRAVGSLESRVLVSTRRFHELEATGTEREIDPAFLVDITPRPLQAAGKVRVIDENRVDGTK